MIERVSVVLRGTVCGDIDWCFDNLSGGHHQSQASQVIILSLMMTSAQVLEASVNVIADGPSQNCTRLNNHNLPTYEIRNSNKTNSFSLKTDAFANVPFLLFCY